MKFGMIFENWNYKRNIASVLSDSKWCWSDDWVFSSGYVLVFGIRKSSLFFMCVIRRQKKLQNHRILWGGTWPIKQKTQPTTARIDRKKYVFVLLPFAIWLVTDSGNSCGDTHTHTKRFRFKVLPELRHKFGRCSLLFYYSMKIELKPPTGQLIISFFSLARLSVLHLILIFPVFLYVFFFSFLGSFFVYVRDERDNDSFVEWNMSLFWV